jgi:hypothetical protein
MTSFVLFVFLKKDSWIGVAFFHDETETQRETLCFFLVHDGRAARACIRGFNVLLTISGLWGPVLKVKVTIK